MDTLTPRNPYCPTGLLESSNMFFGRTIEIDEIVERRIKHTQPISTILIGGRKIGKTWLLKRIERYLTEVVTDDTFLIPAYVNLLSITDLSPKSVFDKILVEIIETLKHHDIYVTAAICEGDAYTDYCMQLWTIWKQCSKSLGSVRFVILLDEADRLLNHVWTTDIVSNLRDMINTSDLRFFVALIVTGFRELHEYAMVETEGMGSVLGNAAYWSSLGVFSEDESRRLITEPLQGTIAEDVVLEIYEQSGGHPFIIQYLMQQVWKSNAAHISFDNVQVAVQGFYSQIKIFRSWEDRFTDWDILVYCTLASLGGLGDLENIHRRLMSKGNIGELEDALEFLSYTGIVGKQNGLYSISGKLFSDWFLRRHPEAFTDRRSLEHRLAIAQENLLVVEEAESDFAEPKDVPLNLRLSKRRLERTVNKLQAKLNIHG